MKLAYWLVLASLSTVAVSQLVVPQQQQQSHQSRRLAKAAAAANQPHIGTESSQQQPIAMPGPAVPSDGKHKGSNDGDDGGPTGSVILSDVMGRDRSINVFAGFTRDFATVTNRFDDAAQNSTVLAPLNSAIEALPRKPWEDPQDYAEHGADVYEGGDGQERAQRNLRRFVEAHIVPVSPWPEKSKANALSGNAEELWWEMKDGVRVIQPGNIEVQSVASTVANGQVWIIKGVRNYSS